MARRPVAWIGSVRSLEHLVELLGELLGEIWYRSVDLYLHQQGLDPAGWVMFHMLNVFSEFECVTIIDRTKAGLNRAKAQEQQYGWPPAYPAKEKVIGDLLTSGKGVIKVPREAGVGVGIVHRIRKNITDLSPNPTH
ncbi:recombinase family protein [Azospirillum argentinense]|uniref:recombinase family protein n=1 Tax=Azospirillum argentinense TaxID=2970906 RepID=UPI00068CBFC5|nr:recombinase family protein [Azospirillum argentinense]